ncbi:hypothetical protein VOLCADRAFT_102667 [Volvox carteri f. nagariensis]|uniref:Uncharacterized protein n=1 Tax=Volvox carteri f. nagariensis TaxID=3068 RepID=D8THD4_VOLCA|nr:uncharacterized protein VOLCADRAFT_102667 [Volvox carteri f. nagariensis]EFJ52691.1 hypothetical protein VOLCADRAFT_102667 [Volvox carteri f. nagariensis]|eukprot:XP_002945696.1 hypothetical protein VOLCADRAFT_102667 [Volvox carteri f. nagariensis]
MVQHRDPLVEGLLRLGKATDFRQPAEGGAATTRAQVIRHLRPQNRDAVSAIISAFHGAEDAQRLRAAANKAKDNGARTGKEVTIDHKLQAALRCLEARKARVREQELAQDQLEAQVRSQLGAGLEDQAKLTRLQLEQQQQRERANLLALLVNRSRRLRPSLEEFTYRQRQQIQAVRSRMLGEADPGGDGATVERVGQMCALVQQELWMQLNAASMDAAAAGGMHGSLMLTSGGDPLGVDPFAGALSAPFPGANPQPELEKFLHLPRSSVLQRQLSTFLLLPPQKLVHAICQGLGHLSRSSRNGLSVLVGGWDLLADARRRCQALGAAVDPLYDVRKMQQAQVDSYVELRRLENQVLAAKTRLTELAMLPAVKQALSQPTVRTRVKNEGVRAALGAGRASFDVLIRDAEDQGELVEEVGRLEAAAFELEREERRLESLVSLLTNSLGQVLSEWQQQYPANQEFVHRMLPKVYGDLADRAARNIDSLSRGVSELMRVPCELLPVMAEQRRMQRLQGGDVMGTAAAAVGSSGQGRPGSGSLGFPSLNSLSLVERLRLTLPYVGPQRAIAMLRASAASGCSAYLGVASTHGSLFVRSSAASTASSQGAQSSTSDVVLLGACSVSGSVSASLNAGSGCWAGSGSWSGAAQGQGLGSGLAAAAAAAGWGGGGRGSGAAENLHGTGGTGAGGGGSGGLGGSCSWLGATGAASSAPAVAWGPGPAALGLPTLCYWLAAASALDPLAPLRCPAALLRDLNDRFQNHDQAAKWLTAADAQLRSRQRDVAALQSTVLALREALEAKRQSDATEMLDRLMRSRKGMLKSVDEYAPRVRRAMREMEEQGAVKLVPWRKVNGLTALEMLNEIRSIFARVNQLQQQPLQPHERPYGALMPPPARPAF